jgi:hypothetical protein
MNNFDLRHIGQGYHIGVTTSKPVELRNTLLLTDNTEDITLDVKITADFSTIPEKYHEVFLNMLTSKYYGMVSFGNNPFSQCLPPKEKKWWQFWKNK